MTLDSGQVLDPADYLGPRVPGRSVAILGDTCDSAEMLDVAPRGLDVLGGDTGYSLNVITCLCSVHEATMENKLREKCVEFGHSTPAMAAQVAAAVNAKTLILSHVSPRYKPLSLWSVALVATILNYKLIVAVMTLPSERSLHRYFWTRQSSI